MRRRSRIRRVMKWMGALLCTAFAMAFFLSIGRHTTLCQWSPRDRISLHRGALLYQWDWRDPPQPRVARIIAIRASYFDPVIWKPQLDAKDLQGVIVLPLWILVAAVAAPTAFVWWFDRPRFLRGHCQHCGYDLTGNVSGRCPECGTPTKPEGKAE